MKKIKNIDTALSIFEEAAIKQAEAIEEGNYKMGNKQYDKIVRAMIFIKSENAVNRLKKFLCYPSVGVRLWAASYLLRVDEKEGTKALEKIAKSSSSGIHGLTAETTLSEWKKGNLT